MHGSVSPTIDVAAGLSTSASEIKTSAADDASCQRIRHRLYIRPPLPRLAVKRTAQSRS